MQTLNGYPVKRSEVGKYIVQLSFEDESTSLEDAYLEQEDINDIIASKYTWCVGIVTVYKNGIELASNSIGHCIYKYDSIIEDFEYYGDLVEETIGDAEQVIEELLK